MTKKTVGILTFQYANNYGALLQAYALVSFLEKSGHNPYIINYKVEPTTVYSYLTHPISLVRKVFEKKAFSAKYLFNKNSEQHGRIRETEYTPLFDEFRRSHLPITKESYNYARLVQDHPRADAYIVGSDQVWAADFIFNSPAFLLKFAPGNIRKISYAPSFGKAKLENYLRPIFRREISKFHAVSVREKSGVSLIKCLTGITPSHVIDPTLLLTDYSEIIDYSLVPEHPYLLSYRLAQSTALTQWLNSVITEIATHLKLPVYTVSTSACEHFPLVGEELTPTPGQLLGLIEKSSFFATNSFHGSVFAIIFRVAFMSFARDSAPDKQNLRMMELLSSLQLSELYCSDSVKPEQVTEMLPLSIDFDKAHDELEQLRRNSANFLLSALS